ncbi:MAG: lytic murein transglycosylase B, partial [Gammaproteobacteria bacterium]|nr:lytic murein transglycosylase B [Gammaproteobacteria bacterium]
MKQLVLLFSLFVPAAMAAVVIPAGDYKHREDVQEFINRLARNSDYTEVELIELFSQVKKQSHLFERLDRPAEKELQWHQYKKIFIKEKRISRGVEFWRKYKTQLAEVSAKTGVPEQIIVAIIGVETFYGIYKGKDPVFDSLVTISFDYPRRTKFFTRELEEFLLLVKEQNLDPLTIRGSYAGAMGMPQFISSSYRNYAVDGDGDGQVNLFDNIADITASVANYFVRHGWQAGQAVAKPLTAIADNSVARLEPGVKTNYKWSDLTDHGLVSNHRIAAETPVALVRLEQKKYPEYWAGLNNFYVITR